MHLLRPYLLFVLLPVWYMCWRYISISATDNWKNICDAHLLPHLLVSSARRSLMFNILLTLGCTIAVFALSGPSWHQLKKPVYRQLVGTVVVLNLSPSMSGTLGTTSKIDRARYKLLDYLREDQEGLTGLIVYTDEAHVITPLTEDRRTVANFVPALDTTIMPTQEDDTSVALKAAEKLLKRANINEGHILLITDKVTQLSASLQQAREMSQRQYHLQILNMAENHDATLEQLAKAGGGHVISITSDNQDITTLSQLTQKHHLVKMAESTKEKGLFWEDEGYRFVLFLLLIALFAFRNGVIE